MKSSSSTKPLKQYAGDIRAGADALKDSYTQNAGDIQGYTDQTLGLLDGVLDRARNGDAGVNAARNYNVDVLGGRYLGEGNPYLQQMINQSGNDVRNQAQAALGVRGLTGGSDYAGLIADRVAQNSLGLRYQDYGAERNRMATAAGQAGTVAAAEAIPYQTALGLLDASTTPIQAAAGYASGVGGLLSPYQKTTQKGSIGGLLGGIAGAGLSGWASGGFKIPKGGFL